MKKNCDEIERVVSGCSSYLEAGKKLGVSHQTISRVVSKFGLDVTHFPKGKGSANPNYKHGKHCEKQMCSCGREKDLRAIQCSICARKGYSKIGDKLASDEDVKKAVEDNDTFLKAAKSLGVTRQVVNRTVERLGLDISHFRKGRGRPYTDDELFRAGHKGRVTVRNRYYKLDPSKYVCSVCGQLPLWNGKPLKLEVDHQNGDRTDNRLVNLRWICPNCHAQQPTCKGLNYHKYGNKRQSKKVL